MAIILPNGLSPAEIRVLQEFRRTSSETMTIEAIKAIKHPAGGGDAPALSLVRQGYLEAVAPGDSFTTTQKARDLLAYDPVPYDASPADAAASAVSSAEADDV